MLVDPVPETRSTSRRPAHRRGCAAPSNMATALRRSRWRWCMRSAGRRQRFWQSCRTEVSATSDMMSRRPFVIDPRESTLGKKVNKLAAVVQPEGLSGEGRRGPQHRRLSQGRHRLSQGEPADAVFFIQKGKVKVTVISEQGREAVTDRQRQFDPIGSRNSRL
jgi:hypothetical protein